MCVSWGCVSNPGNKCRGFLLLPSWYCEPSVRWTKEMLAVQNLFQKKDKKGPIQKMHEIIMMGKNARDEFIKMKKSLVKSQNPKKGAPDGLCRGT